MSFSICVATSSGTAKVNLQFFFDRYAPTVAQLLSRATEAFTRLFRIRGYAAAEFAISLSMIFDEVLQRWVPLERSAQLHHGAQVYVFQPDTHDAPGEIPDPVQASQLLTDYASPSRDVSSPPRALPAYDPVPYAPRAYHSPYQDLSPSRRDTYRQLSAVAPLPRSIDPIPFVPCDSILQEERLKENRKLELPVDEHRSVVRQETSEFTRRLSASPDRR